MATSGTRPRSLILTVYGAFVREIGGWISIADLIKLMESLGVDAQAVRSSISRAKRRGTVVAEQRGRSVGYALSDEMRAVFAEGDRRIFGGHGQARLADGWVIVVFSVPESQRQQRHVLRSRLTWLGFGNAAPGVWVAPAHLLEETRATFERLGLTKYAHLFRADYVDFRVPREAVGQWWDLEGLQDLYGAFVDRYRPVLRAWSSDRAVDDEAAFRDYVIALDDWRRLPYLDPGLPAELLPRRWNGAKAAAVFTELSALLRNPALRHVEKVTGYRPPA